LFIHISKDISKERESKMNTESSEIKHRNGNWIAGAVLIVLGFIFLLQNFMNIHLGNWWALFIMIPAVGAFGRAWQAYNESGGQLNSAARRSLMGGLLLTMLTAVFLFNLSWSVLGPLFLILIGLSILANGAMK
jgi:multidrug transporter EmrE-like cation transporter